MNIRYLLICSLLATAVAHAGAVPPFKAKCAEGETHRYDSGNGQTIAGDHIEKLSYGWSTEKWGDMDVAWSGDKTIVVEDLELNVLYAEDGVIAAAWHGVTGMFGPAVNTYSLIIDTELGQAIYSQVQSTHGGQNRSIKVRSQDLRCAFQWLH